MKKITVSDKTQKHYVYWLSEPCGKNFHKDFNPDLSPKQMLELGVFCGKYLNDCKNEFPKNWFNKAKTSPKIANCEMNYFKIKASKSLSYWRKKGWIHPEDPRGWFQWYCRYYMGRRMDDDQRQIKRWKAMKRHIAQVKKNCVKADELCRKKQRQALLHWAYDSREI